MTVGMIFYVIAAIAFFLAGVGLTVVPRSEVWGLFCIAIGLLLDEYDLGLRRHR